MIGFEDILDRVEVYNPQSNQDLLRRAYVFSALEHKGQVRRSGEPYLVHPLHVAAILAEMKADDVSIVVGLLHDVLEDTLTTRQSIEKQFGPEVAELVDFMHLGAEESAGVALDVERRMKGSQAMIEKIRARLAEKMAEAGIAGEVTGRVKRYYSIAEKMRRREVDAAELYDVLAFRIVTPETRDCYAALGLVHQLWRPVPGRIKDYIAMPKPNFYQSLHTTVMGEAAQPFEIQIRTREMDLISERGIAAHWKYKEGRLGPHADDARFQWLRQLVDWQSEGSDPRQFLASLKGE